VEQWHRWRSNGGGVVGGGVMAAREVGKEEGKKVACWFRVKDGGVRRKETRLHYLLPIFLIKSD